MPPTAFLRYTTPGELAIMYASVCNKHRLPSMAKSNRTYEFLLFANNNGADFCPYLSSDDSYSRFPPACPRPPPVAVRATGALQRACCLLKRRCRLCASVAFATLARGRACESGRSDKAKTVTQTKSSGYSTGRIAREREINSGTLSCFKVWAQVILPGLFTVLRSIRFVRRIFCT